MILQLLTCSECEGAGELICHHCNGNGTRNPESPRAMICQPCRGMGLVCCNACEGAGEIQEATGEIEGEDE